MCCYLVVSEFDDPKDTDLQHINSVFAQLEYQITGMKNGNIPFTMILDDPKSNSYLEVSL